MLKDKNGVEIRIGDRMKHTGGVGSEATVTAVGAKGFDGVWARDGEHLEAVDTDVYWTVLRRADGSAPERLATPETHPVTWSQRNAALINQHFGQQTERGWTQMVQPDPARAPTVNGQPVQDIWIGARPPTCRHCGSAGPLTGICNDVLCIICAKSTGALESVARALVAAPKPSLQDRYATFRATVERVVREEAPKARVVTDLQCSPERFIAWVTMPLIGEQALLHYPSWHDDMEGIFREQMKMLVTDVTTAAGRAALGAK